MYLTDNQEIVNFAEYLYRAIFEEGELDEFSVVKEYLTTADLA